MPFYCGPKKGSASVAGNFWARHLAFWSRCPEGCSKEVQCFLNRGLVCAKYQCRCMGSRPTGEDKRYGSNDATMALFPHMGQRGSVWNNHLKGGERRRATGEDRLP